MDRPSGHRHAWAAGIAGFLASLLTSAVLGAPSVEALQHDSAEYARLAVALLESGRLLTSDGVPEVVRTPGYPAFLALHFALFGPKLWPVFTSHALLHGGAAVLVLRLARHLGFDARWALGLGFAFALYPYALHGASRILTEALTTLLVISATTLLVEKAPSRALGAGVVGGLTALVRPSFSLLPIAWAVFLAVRGERRAAALSLAGALVLMLPWAVRTSVAVGAPAGLTAGGAGHNLHIAAFEYRDLSNGLPPTTDYRGPAFEQSDARARAEVEVPSGTAAFQRALDQARLRRALDEIAEHPGLYLRSTALRIIKIWVSQSAPGLPNWAGHLSALVGLVILGLGIAGAVELWPWSRAWTLVLLPALYLVALHAPLHAEARYTLPARPALLLAAGALLRSRKDTLLVLRA